MDNFNFCWTALVIEAKRTNVLLDINNCEVKNNYDEELDKPIKRVSYLYKYGSFNINFFMQCMSRFTAEVPDSLKIFDKICAAKSLNICSLSTGPGTHVIGFLRALHLLGKPLKGSVNFKFISKHVAWRNAVCQMLSSVPVNVPVLSSCKLIQWDVLTKITPKAESYIKISDVLFLCHTFSSTKADKNVTDCVLRDILQLLKTGALVFFIFKESDSRSLKEFNTFGQFLYGPTAITLINMPYDKTVSNLMQVTPIDTGSSFFAVWQKSDSLPLEDKSPTVKLHKLSTINETFQPQQSKTANNCEVTQNIFKLHDSFRIDNSSLSESVISKATSSDNVSVTSKATSSDSVSVISKAASSDNVSVISETTSRDNVSVSTESSSSKIEHKVESNSTAMPKSNCGSQTHFIKSKELCPLPTNMDSSTVNQKEKSKKGNLTNMESPLNSLIKTLERLVTNLEGFVNSQITDGNRKNPQGCLGCPCHLQNVPVGSSSIRHCNFNSCECNRGHLSCIKNHHTCSNNFNQCNCSSASNQRLFHNHENQTSHLVIPVQNITDNALAQVFSLVSQINSSSNDKSS